MELSSQQILSPTSLVLNPSLLFVCDASIKCGRRFHSKNPCVSLMVNSVTSQHQFSLRLRWSRTYALCDLYSCCCKQFSAQIAALVSTQADFWLICLTTGGFKNILCIQKEKRVIKDSQNRPKHLHSAENVSCKNDRDTFALLNVQV